MYFWVIPKPWQYVRIYSVKVPLPKWPAKESIRKDWKGDLPRMSCWVGWPAVRRCIMEPMLAGQWRIAKPLEWQQSFSLTRNSWKWYKATWDLQKRPVSHLQANNWWALGSQWHSYAVWLGLFFIAGSIEPSWPSFGSCLPGLQLLHETWVARASGCKHQNVYQSLAALA